MISHERQEKRTKLYNSVVTFFDAPVKNAGWWADSFWVEPFRAVKRNDFNLLIRFVIFPEVFILGGTVLPIFSFILHTMHSMLKLGWHGLNCLMTELCSDDPFASNDAQNSYSNNSAFV